MSFLTEQAVLPRGRLSKRDLLFFNQSAAQKKAHQLTGPFVYSLSANVTNQ
jgi:hypothetical protein